MLNIGGEINNIGKAFAYCGKLKDINLIEKNKNYTIQKHALLSKNRKTLWRYFGNAKTYKVPKTVKTIAHSAFSKSKTIRTLELNKNLKTIEDEAFYECTHLKNIKFNKKLKTIGNEIFGLCRKLKKINLKSNPDIAKYAFRYTNVQCVVDYPDFNKARPSLYWAKYAEYDEDDKIPAYFEIQINNVKEADGYEIRLAQGNKKQILKRNGNGAYYKIKKKKLKVNFEKAYENPKEVSKIKISVRAYKKENGKTIYTKWSKKYGYYYEEYIPCGCEYEEE